MLDYVSSEFCLAGLLRTGEARVGVIGLGYVGLPLAAECAKVFPTLGFDVDPLRVSNINEGKSHIGDVSSARVGELVGGGSLAATIDFRRLKSCDAIVICVPTPLDKNKHPDLSYIQSAVAAVAQNLRPGQLIILESTTYPGTTQEVLLPLCEATGLRLDRDFWLAFSPERIDPGNHDFAIAEIPKVVGGCSAASTEMAVRFYSRVVNAVHPVSDSRVAEAAKLFENTFRSVNIALANEMAMMCHNLDIDTTEVINAAATKPFGFMPFYPGPGVGGHCIPLDPLYLSWKSKQHGFAPRFIGLSDEINTAMPDYIVQLVAAALNDERKSLRGSRVLILGISYKEDVADMRHSPALAIIQNLRSQGSDVRYHDRHVPRLTINEADALPDRVHARSDRRCAGAEKFLAAVNAPDCQASRRRADSTCSTELTTRELQDADCVVIVTAHGDVDYAMVAQHAKLVIDTRRVLPDGGVAKVVNL